MKAIVFTAGSDGDVHPHFALGRELRARGHEVVFLTTFEYVDEARALGFRPVCLLAGDDKREMVEAAARLKPLERIRAYLAFLESRVTAGCLAAAQEIDDDTVLVSPTVLSGVARLLHDRFGTPYVSTLLTPADLISLRDPPFYRSLRRFAGLPYWLRKPLFHAAERCLIDPLCRRLLRGSAQALGRTLSRRLYSRWLYSPQRIVGLFPEWFCRRPPDWPAHVALSGFPQYRRDGAGRVLDESLLRFLDDGPPPVAVTAGTETKEARAFFATAVEALQAAGRRGIVISRLDGQIPPLPQGIVHAAYLPLDVLLPRVRAFVHHGGIGTAALALRAGVPQLMLPTFSNQYDNARRVAALGCGIRLEGARDAAALAAALRALDAPDYAVRCAAVQAMTEPGDAACRRAADLVEGALVEGAHVEGAQASARTASPVRAD